MQWLPTAEFFRSFNIATNGVGFLHSINVPFCFLFVVRVFPYLFCYSFIPGFFHRGLFVVSPCFSILLFARTKNYLQGYLCGLSSTCSVFASLSWYLSRCFGLSNKIHPNIVGLVLTVLEEKKDILWRCSLSERWILENININ